MKLSKIFPLISLLLFIQLANAASLASSVDRFRMGEDETLVLTITYDDANISGQPNLSGLESSFEILNSSSSSETRVVNGSISSNKKWRYTLIPKNAGKLLIPSFSIKGSYSNPIEIEVVDNTTLRSRTSTNRGDLFIEATVNKQEAYVQEIIILTLRIYTSVQITKPKLPELTLPGLMIEKMGESQFETRETDRNYYVLEYRYALFAHKSGELIIPKQRYQISQIISNGPRSLFDIRDFGTQTQARFLSTEDIPITIKPIPTSNPAPYWLASDDVTLTDNWPEEQNIELGTPITRSIEIRALGNLGANIPPLPDNTPTKLKEYREQPSLSNTRAGETLLATRIENIAIVAVEPGLYALPEIQLHWWSNKEKRFKTSTLPERRITAQATAHDTELATPISVAPIDIKTASAANNSSNSSITPTSFYLNVHLWMGVSASLLITLLSVVFIVFRRRKIISSVKTTNHIIRQHSIKNRLKEMREACRLNDARQARIAIIHWAEKKWPDDAIFTLDDVKQKINDPGLRALLEELDSTLYKNLSHWNGQPLLDFFNSSAIVLEKNNSLFREKSTEIPNLYD